MPYIPEAPGPKKTEKATEEQGKTNNQKFQILLEVLRTDSKSQRLETLAKVAQHEQDSVSKRENVSKKKSLLPEKEPTPLPSKEIQKTLDGMEKLQAALKEAEAEEKAGKDSSLLLKELAKAVALLKNGGFNTKQLEHFASLIVKLNQNLPHLPPKLKTLVTQALTALGTLQSHSPGTKQSEDLSVIVASILVSGWQRDYIASAKSPTKKGGKAAVKGKAKSADFDSSVPFLAKVASAIKKTISSYPEASGLGDKKLSFEDSAFMTNLGSTIALDSSKSSHVQTTIETHSTKAAALVQPLTDHTNALGKLSKSPATRDIAYEITYLKKLIAVLLKYLGKDPALAKELKADLGSLEKISKDYPHLTKADVEKLQKILSSANSMQKKLPDAGKREFISLEIKMLQAMTDGNKVEISKLEKELKSYQELAALQKVLKQIRALISQLQSNGKLSTTQMQELLADVSLLRRVMPSLPKSAQINIQGILHDLSGFSGSYTVNGKTYKFSLANVMADLKMYNWILEYNATAKDPTKAGLMAFLKKKIAEFEKTATGPMGQKMLKELQADLQGYPKPADGQGIIKDFNDPNFMGSLQHAFTMYGTPISEIDNFDQLVTNIFTIIDSSTKIVEDIEKDIAEYKALNNVYKKDINDLQINHMWASSLQAGFASAIIDHYMPGQEAYLNQLAMLLFFSNFGANMDNQILSAIIGFSNANNDFNSSNWFGSRNLGKKIVYKAETKYYIDHIGKHTVWVKTTETVYSGTTTQAQAEIKKEIENAESDISKAQKALGKISAQEAKIQQEVKDGKLTKAQGAKLTKELQGYKADLTASISKMHELVSNLKQLKIEPVYDKDGNPIPNEFKIGATGNEGAETVMGNIQSNENTLVNGTASQGGLVQINSDITAAQKSWGSQSQTNQMQLQLVMTEIQQEWSIVSTAMSMLNQMYLTVARGIGGK